MKGKGGEEGMKAKVGNVTKLFNYVPFFVLLVMLVPVLVTGTGRADVGMSIASSGGVSSGSKWEGPGKRQQMLERIQEQRRMRVKAKAMRAWELLAEGKKGGRKNNWKLSAAMRKVATEIAPFDCEWEEVPKFRPVALELIRGGGPQEQLAAMGVLGAIGGPEDVAILKEMGKKGDVGPPEGNFLPYASYANGYIVIIQARERIVKAIEGLPPPEQAQRLADEFRRKRGVDIDHICRRLIQLGPPAVPALVELLDQGISWQIPGNNYQPVIHWVPEILDEIGDPRALPGLERLLAYHRRFATNPKDAQVKKTKDIISRLSVNVGNGGDEP